MTTKPLSIVIFASAFLLSACGKQESASQPSANMYSPVSMNQSAPSKGNASASSGQFEEPEQLGHFLSNTIWASENTIFNFGEYDPGARTRIVADVHYIGAWAHQSSVRQTWIRIPLGNSVDYNGVNPVRDGQIEGFTRITEERMHELLASKPSRLR